MAVLHSNRTEEAHWLKLHTTYQNNTVMYFIPLTLVMQQVKLLKIVRGLRQYSSGQLSRLPICTQSVNDSAAGVTLR